jgi:hypothetical protein
MKIGSLKQAMGRPEKKAKYESLEEFSNYLKTINKARLQDLCMESGLVPSHERRMMIRALEKHFKRASAKSVRVVESGHPTQKSIKKPSSKSITE